METAVLMKFLAAIIPTIISGATSIGNSVANRRDFLENRDYNNPSNRMAMMVNAGINPNAAAAGISGTQPEQPFVATSNVSSDTSSLAEMLSDATSTLYHDEKEQATVENIKADTKNKDSETELNFIEKVFRPKSYEASLKLASDQHLMNNENIKLLQNDVKFCEAISKETLNNLKASGNVMRAQYKLIKAETAAKYQEAKTLQAQENYYNEAAISEQVGQFESLHRQEGMQKSNAILQIELEEQTRLYKMFKDLGFPPEASPLLAHYLELDDKSAQEFADDCNTFYELTSQYNVNLAVQTGYRNIIPNAINSFGNGVGTGVGIGLGVGSIGSSKGRPIGYIR